ncbi:MAG: FHA domain-containing protein [Anaerolineae bacterium]
MKEQRNNLWWLLCLVGFVVGLLLLPAWAWSDVLAQDPTPTLPPAVWMTPVSGEGVPGISGPNYLLLGGIALVLLVLGGAVLLGIAVSLARRRKTKQPAAPASAFATLPGYALVVRAGPGAETRYPLVTPGAVVMGRAPDCHVVINFPNVSGHHARLTWDGQQFVVEDLNSTNGTFVNGYRLTGPVQFRPGDVLSLGGSVELVLQVGG